MLFGNEWGTMGIVVVLLISLMGSYFSWAFSKSTKMCLYSKIPVGISMILCVAFYAVMAILFGNQKFALSMVAMAVFSGILLLEYYKQISRITYSTVLSFWSCLMVIHSIAAQPY